jgi:FixJ family two-component response regulator
MLSGGRLNLKPRIIIIDDDPNTEDSCAEFLEEVSDSVEYFSNPWML